MTEIAVGRRRFDSASVVAYCTDRSVQQQENRMSPTKTAVVVLSDPQGGDEALGRLFNALAATYDFKQKRQEVQLLFQGAGTRWTAVLTKDDHPAHALYQAVEDRVAGVSAACAVVFG